MNELSDVIKSQINDMKKANVITPAVEFMYDNDGIVRQVEVDQLTNMSAALSASINIDAISLIQSKLDSVQLIHLGFISNLSQLNMVRDQIIAQVSHNLYHFNLNNLAMRTIGYHYLSSDLEAIDKNNDSEGCRNLSIKTILDKFMFRGSGDSEISVTRDDPQSIENTKIMMDYCSKEIALYIIHTIAYCIDRYIDSSTWYNNDKRQLNHVAESLSSAYNYHDLDELKTRFSKEECSLLIIKQIVTIQLVEWYNKVLIDLIFGIISSMGCNMYYIYDDIYKMKEEQKLLEEQNE